MRHFRLNFILCLLGIVAFTVLATLGFRAGYYAPSILLALPAVVSLILLCRLVWRLIHSMSGFVNALEMNDTTVRLVGSDDPDIDRMARTMRRIMDIHTSSRLEMETRKLYYDRILRIMTHEMRNAIAPIVSLSADMERYPDRYRGENYMEAVSLISGESRSISRFLESYYELTHLPAPQIAPVDVKDFFTDIRRSFDMVLAEYNLASDVIVYTVPVGMTIQADRDLLGRLVTNLLRNAVQAVATVPSPGIGIEATLPSPHIDVEVSVSEGRPYIRISDNGCGIPEDVMRNLFQPFFTTKPGGSGIGLYLSRQIARLHGGDVVISSTPARGTAALITLAPDPTRANRISSVQGL